MIEVLKKLLNLTFMSSCEIFEDFNGIFYKICRFCTHQILVGGLFFRFPFSIGPFGN